MKKHNMAKATNPYNGTKTKGELYFKSRALSIPEYNPVNSRIVKTTVKTANEISKVFTYELIMYFTITYFSSNFFITAPPS
jgi:hypothetical protein